MAFRSFPPNDTARLARRIAIGIGLLLAIIVVGCSSVQRIDAAHVGIVVKLAGSDRGIQDIPIRTGWVLYNPLSEVLVFFPTSVQNIVWTKSPTEGPPIDESITFSSQEGVNINADIGLSFHIDPALAPHLYMRFRQNDLLRLADGYVRNAVREAFNNVASTMPVQGIYGPEKSKLVERVMRQLADVLGKDGFLIDQLTINGALRLPPNVEAAINTAMEATQNAIQAENKVRQVVAEAEQAKQLAEGQATAARARARGDADAMLIRAKSEAKSNQIIRLSMSGPVLQYRAVEKWNGKLPMMNGGGALPMLTFDATKFAAAAGDEEKLNKLLEEADEAERRAASGAKTGEAAAPTPPAAPAAPVAPAAPAASAAPGKAP